MSKHKRTAVLLLAAVADVDIRTAMKAYELGPDVIRGRAVRERVREVMEAMGLIPAEVDRGQPQSPVATPSGPTLQAP